MKALFKKLFHRHKWRRYDVLVEQLSVGGYCAWQRCSECRKIKFASADKYMLEEPGWKEHKARIEAIMGRSEADGVI